MSRLPQPPIGCAQRSFVASPASWRRPSHRRDHGGGVFPLKGTIGSGGGYAPCGVAPFTWNLCATASHQTLKFAVQELVFVAVRSPRSPSDELEALVHGSSV